MMFFQGTLSKNSFDTSAHSLGTWSKKYQAKFKQAIRPDNAKNKSVLVNSLLSTSRKVLAFLLYYGEMYYNTLMMYFFVQLILSTFTITGYYSLDMEIFVQFTKTI